MNTILRINGVIASNNFFVLHSGTVLLVLQLPAKFWKIIKATAAPVSLEKLSWPISAQGNKYMQVVTDTVIRVQTFCSAIKFSLSVRCYNIIATRTSAYHTEGNGQVGQ